ncbi:SRPBCC family protein [Hymenobacter gummosus]|uniref:SRPBCC family protein n=1 Tax=Hymenobacter gummosus TaxID=1776032 RepID=A0A3S0IQ28_9BACT|nr:SRPBCC family protein [Hymenobacter gummosus]RTQ51485.1 SRPBCC family protein [Hymenobacter gummosus]
MDPTNPQPDFYNDDAPAPARGFRHWLLGTPLGCATLAVLPTAVLCTGLTFLSTNVYRAYGASVFLASPFICGLVANAIYTRLNGARHKSLIAMHVVIVLAVLCTLALLIGTALEGLICVAMAAPLALVMALLGAWLGEKLADLLGPARSGYMFTLLVLLYPLGQDWEAERAAPPAPHLVSTRLLIQAPPARVWQVISQPVQYPAEVGWLFRAGVAYPTRTAIERGADGRPRLRCNYSQGAATLPVTRWQPGRELTFVVPVMPAPMRELSPYPRIHAPHLHGFFRVDSGTFRLHARPDGTTLLEARTVYRHSIGPRGYWQLWSDYLLDDVHLRVLTAIKTRAEHE